MPGHQQRHESSATFVRFANLHDYFILLVKELPGGMGLPAIPQGQGEARQLKGERSAEPTERTHPCQWRGPDERERGRRWR